MKCLCSLKDPGENDAPRDHSHCIHIYTALEELSECLSRFSFYRNYTKTISIFIFMKKLQGATRVSHAGRRPRRYYQNTFHVSFTLGAQTESPALLSPAPNTLSYHHPAEHVYRHNTLVDNYK